MNVSLECDCYDQGETADIGDDFHEALKFQDYLNGRMSRQDRGVWRNSLLLKNLLI